MLFHSNSTVASVRKIPAKAEEKTIKTWNELWGGGSWCCFRALLRDCLAALFLSCVRHSCHTTCGHHPCVFCLSLRVRASLRQSNSLHLFHLPSHSNCKVTGALNPPHGGKTTPPSPPLSLPLSIFNTRNNSPCHNMGSTCLSFWTSLKSHLNR